MMWKAFEKHMQMYPCHEWADEVKFLYQACMGGGHLITDEQNSYQRIWQEMQQSTITGFQIELLSEQLCRIHFGHLSERQVRVLNRVFVYSANHFSPNAKCLKQALETLSQKRDQTWQAKTASYLEKGMPPLSHSYTYRQAYQPCYRVVLRSVWKYADLLLRLEELLAAQTPFILGIDGRCGSGKSSLADLLHKMYKAPIIAMDDFFLPLEKRTAARYAQPGGNVDYERFEQTVKPALLKHEAFAYQVFDCSIMRFGALKQVPSSLWYIVEGTYSMHPTIVDLYDLKVFLSVSKEEQKARILARNGEAMYEKFATLWIPLEEQYFSGLHIAQNADFVYHE